MTIEITLLTQSDCRLCDHAKTVLAQLAGEFDVAIREVDLSTPEGRALGTTAGMAFPPAVLIDGQPFGFGRLSERRLRRDFTRRQRPRR